VQYNKLERYGLIILVGLMVTGAINWLMHPGMLVIDSLVRGVID